MSTTVSIKFDVTPGKIALAMTLAAVDSLEDVNYGIALEQDHRITALVNKMSKAKAMQLVKDGFKFYGSTLWPDLPECAREARIAAYEKACSWVAPADKPKSDGRTISLHEVPLSDSIRVPSTFEQ